MQTMAAEMSELNQEQQKKEGEARLVSSYQQPEEASNADIMSGTRNVTHPTVPRVHPNPWG